MLIGRKGYRAAFGGGPGPRGSTIVSPSSSTPLNRRDTPSDSPNIRWNELLGHFRHVQKKRAALLSNSPGSLNGVNGGGNMSMTATDSFDTLPPLGTSSYAGSAPSSRIMPAKRRGPNPPNQPVPSRSEGSLAGFLANQGGAGSGFTTTSGPGSRIAPRPSAGGGGGGSGSQAGSGSSAGIPRDGNATPIAVQRAVSPTAQATKRRIGLGVGGAGGALAKKG